MNDNHDSDEEQKDKNRKLFRDIMKEKHGIDPVVINQAKNQLLKEERVTSWKRWYVFTRFLQFFGYMLCFSSVFMMVAIENKTTVHWVLAGAALLIGWGIAVHSTEELKEFFPEKFPNMSNDDNDPPY